MNRKHLFIFLILLIVITGTVGLVTVLKAQEKLPIIRANSIHVDIRDGGIFKKSAWRIVPEAKPDIYKTSNINSKVVFYTDLDSISFDVKPDKKYRFIILLNNKDSALTEILYIPSYRETLKKAYKYNNKDLHPIPKFTYQSSDYPELKSLRLQYKLDSVAGNGDEFSKVKNLLFWLHNLVPHDGQHGNPEIKNAASMIAECKRDKRGLNCRGLAMTLNECYLSMGFKSRYVTCLPKDSLKIDKDCHVINTVFLNSLKKWIWIDPTFNAYILDENGNPLSISEVRQRIIDDKPLTINSEADYNGKKNVIKEEYLFNYMAKNLYIMECPVISQYDTETYKETRFPERPKIVEYIKLLPLDYFKQYTDKDGEKYNTNNSELFWEKP